MVVPAGVELPQALYDALLQGPALMPPEGMQSNFVNPNTLSVYVVPTIVLSLVFTTLALAMRIYTQHAIFRPLYWEDYTAILAWLMYIGFCIPNIITARHGGAHQWDTRLEELFLLLKWSNLVQILYGPVIFCVKLSILLQYLRIFVPSRSSNMGMFIGICIVFWGHMIFYIIDTFVQIFSCYPREKAWNKLIAVGHCVDLASIYVASGAVNVASDIIVLALPIVSVWKLEISTKQKLQVSAAFATGFLVIVASVARLIYIILLFRTHDQTRAMIPPGLFGLAEISLGLICSCLPTMPMFFHVVGMKMSTVSIFGYNPFKKATPQTPFNTTASGIRSTQRWDESGNKRLTKSYRELADWQLNSRGTQLVQISSAGRRTTSDDDDLENGLIVQTTTVEVEETKKLPQDVTGRSYYVDSK